MADEITSTDRKLLYKVRFTPGGETYYVEAGNAQTAQGLGIGHHIVNALPNAVVEWTGIDVERASKKETELYYEPQELDEDKPWDQEGEEE